MSVPDKARLRVLQVVLSRGFAGSERAAAEACNALCAEHDVALVLRRDHRSSGGASIRDFLDSRVEVFELPPYWRTRARLRAVIEAWRPDIVHTHLRRGTRYVVQIDGGVPHVCTLHLSLNSRHYLRTDAIVCISEWQHSTLPSTYPGRVFLIPNSLIPQQRIDAARRDHLRSVLGAQPGDFLVGGAGRLARTKGFDVLIEAFRRAALPHARLVIIGEGSQRQRLERAAAGSVVFTGFREDVKDCLQALDLFVSASRKEPFGRVIIEALDAAVPVIATDTLGPRDIACRYPVELVPCDDAAALAAALRRAHAGPRGTRPIDLSEFHIDRIAEHLLRAYRDVMSGHAGPAVSRAARLAQQHALQSAHSQSPVVPHEPTAATRLRYLFSPVSGPGGAGELMRCLNIARELVRAEPDADIHFLVNRTAVFREAVEFPIHDCDASPTNSTPQVLAAIEAFRPHVVVFDNSGRVVQLRAARAAGARIVYSSRAPHLRRKGFRLSRMRLLDEHWIVFPGFITGDLTWHEKLKLRYFPDYTVRRLDTLFTPSDPAERRAWLSRNGLASGGYTVFVPGGRSEAQQVTEPTELFIAAAREFVAATGQVAVVLTGRATVPAGGEPRELLLMPRIRPEEVQHVLAGAQLVVSNGGTTMVHALAHHRPLLAVPLASDQDRRIRLAVQLGVAATAPHSASAIAGVAAALCNDAPRRERLGRRIEELGIVNGVGQAVAALRQLARRPVRAATRSPR
jgi:glycosyltransferase involved in cell wall biosynthesis